MRIRLHCAATVLMLSALAPPPAAAAQTDVQVVRDGEAFKVSADSAVAASPALSWTVLTGYETYPDFVPNLSLSRLSSAEPLRIEQRGSFGVLFFRKEIEVTLEVDERPPARIFFRSVAGDLRELETEVAVLPAHAGATIRYRSTIVPGFWVPPLITAPLLRASIRRKLQAVAIEIERRAALETRK